MMIRTIAFVLGALALVQPAAAESVSRARLDAMIASHAQANGVPVALVHRVVVRESRYRPHVIGRGGAMGLMQIKLATARGLGYRGTARGLLDAETNLTYAVRYLAGAYRVAGGNYDRAVMHYARGYYYAAKRKGMLKEVGLRKDGRFVDSALNSFAAAPDRKATRAKVTRTSRTGHDIFSHRDQVIQ
jgi:soluble lytic murein transglycosylase-like protein